VCSDKLSHPSLLPKTMDNLLRRDATNQDIDLRTSTVQEIGLECRCKPIPTFANMLPSSIWPSLCSSLSMAKLAYALPRLAESSEVRIARVLAERSKLCSFCRGCPHSPWLLSCTAARGCHAPGRNERNSKGLVTDLEMHTYTCRRSHWIVPGTKKSNPKQTMHSHLGVHCRSSGNARSSTRSHPPVCKQIFFFLPYLFVRRDFPLHYPTGAPAFTFTTYGSVLFQETPNF